MQQANSRIYSYIESDDETSLKPYSVIIVGTGPVGWRLAEEIVRSEERIKVLMFGDEPHGPYDRIKLSPYLAGEINAPWLSCSEQLRQRITIFSGNRITRIDRKEKQVYDSTGKTWPYSKLVLATGSRPHVPAIPGVTLDNVFCFRNMDDADRLRKRAIRTKHTVVIGGGLLGLEAARAMKRFNARVTVIEQSAWLMFHQLDKEAGKLLREQVEANDIEVLTSSRVQNINGKHSVESITMLGGRKIDCDTVVIASGIVPNTELARDAALYTRRGVLVNSQMKTNDPDIYAVGECTEHRGKVYGLVKPGFEQAAVAASVLTQGSAEFNGSVQVTQLKVIDCPVFSVGEPTSEWYRREVVYRDKSGKILRKLFLSRSRLEAAIAIGEWNEFTRLEKCVTRNQRVWPWQVKRFLETGNLWPVDNELGVVAWPASATVCNCMGVTRGELSDAVSQGCKDIQCLSETTRASTTCGTCRPLLQQLLGSDDIEAVRASSLLNTGAITALLAILAFLFFPNLSYSNSVQHTWHWDVLWRDGFIKQISGFTLLGLSVALAFVSLPKRTQSKKTKFKWGEFSTWRAVHVILAIFTLIILVAHTGLRMGHELNFLLMLTFSGLMLAGVLLSGSIGLQHKLPIAFARSTRNWSLWSHIILLYPLPVLLGFHILKTYWY